MPVALQCRIPLVDTYAGEQTAQGSGKMARNAESVEQEEIRTGEARYSV